MVGISTVRSLAATAALGSLVALSSPAAAFHGGHTGVTEEQLKAACPAFAGGASALIDSVSPPGNLPVTDIFEHETGARCRCTRMRTDKHLLRCGPVAARR